MSKTKTEVKEHCAEILGIKTVGQDITQPWTVKLEHLWDAVYEQVKHENLNVFSSSGPIPTRLYHAFAMLMANMGKDAVSVSNDLYQRISAAEGRSWAEFRKFAVDRYESIDDPTDY